ncbi:hypothetical protein DVA67_020635 [Solirubrobacter sp. CPCC 204708]|nr:hypothetical protein [Solirubrobacter deserti]
MPSSAATPTASLFQSGVRVRGAGLPAKMSDYARLDRRPEPWVVPVRALMDRWFDGLHADAQKSIRPRFTSERCDDHLGAFHELYQHELALRGGYDEVDCDIGREDPGHMRPDLLLRRADARCFVEVTVALGDDVVDPTARPRLQQLYDAIERITVRDFLLHVNVRAVGPDTPGKRLIRRIDGWLRTMDPDEEIARVAADGEAAARRIEVDGWTVDLVATGWQPDLRGRPDLGVIGSIVEGPDNYRHVIEGERRIEFDGPRTLNDDVLLAAALHRKLKHRYELDDLPYVIAVLCAGDFVTDTDIMDALVGPGGVWGHGAPDRSRRLSGIITATNLSPTAVADVEPTLWTNPNADHPVPEDFFPWRRISVSADGDQTEQSATRAVADVLGVSARFPAE